MATCDVMHSDSEGRDIGQCDMPPAWTITVFKGAGVHDVYVYCSDHCDQMIGWFIAADETTQIIATWIHNPKVEISR